MLVLWLEISIDQNTDHPRDIQHGCRTKRIVHEPLKKALKGDHRSRHLSLVGNKPHAQPREAALLNWSTTRTICTAPRCLRSGTAGSANLSTQGRLKRLPVAFVAAATLLSDQVLAGGGIFRNSGQTGLEGIFARACG